MGVLKRVTTAWEECVYTTTIPLINPFSGPAILRIGPKLALGKFMSWFDAEGGKSQLDEMYACSEDQLTNQHEVMTRYLRATLNTYHSITAPIGSWHDYDDADLADLNNLTDEEASIVANWFCETYPGEAQILGPARVVDIIYGHSRHDFPRIMDALMKEAHLAKSSR